MKNDANMMCVICHQHIKGKEQRSFHVYDGGTERQYTGYSVHANCILTKPFTNDDFTSSARAILAFNLLVEEKK